MPTGPIGQRRPADVIGGAIVVARAATDEVTEKTMAGAQVCAQNLSPEARSEIAKQAVGVRWN